MHGFPGVTAWKGLNNEEDRAMSTRWRHCSSMSMLGNTPAGSYSAIDILERGSQNGGRDWREKNKKPTNVPREGRDSREHGRGAGGDLVSVAFLQQTPELAGGVIRPPRFDVITQ